ncbi:MAG: apolipoprotein N-acyltransferase, partial [Cryomorphaceae bacterium]|nr:apolipoprotein N-acyltransferase [Cryomorphaceae bacterium]
PRLILICIPIIISFLVKQKIELGEKFKVLITQPRIDPWSKESDTNLEYYEIFKDLTNEELRTNQYDFVITPETYFSEGYGENVDYFKYSKLHDSLSNYLNDYSNTNLISGIQFYKLYQNQIEKPSRTANLVREKLWIDYYNSSMNFSANKEFEYNHKSKLVVGSEYMPLKSLLEPIFGNIMVDLGGTTVSRGTQHKSERKIFKHSKKNLKTVPIVCYESIYGEYVADYVNLGANFITIISNDAWWGNTPGHRHLLSYARLRAIENRRYIVRSANSGVSSIINEIGEYDEILPFDEKGILSGVAYAIDKKTFYSKNGDFIARISILLSVLLLLISFSRVKE